MDGRRRVPRVLTINDARVYLNSVKETFSHEPAKFKELLKVLNDFMAHRVNGANTIARVEQILKDQQNLLIWFRVFLSKTNIIKKGFDEFQTIIAGKGLLSKPTDYDAYMYLASVEDAFDDEKFDEFVKIIKDINAKRLDGDSGVLLVEELMKDHRNLLLGFGVFLPPGTQLTIPPEQLTLSPRNNKRKRQ